jgi:hypothetical protein
VFGMGCITMQFLTDVRDLELKIKTLLPYCEGHGIYEEHKKGVNYEEE